MSGKEVFKKYDEDLEKEVKTISFRIYPDEGADGLTLDQGVWDIGRQEFERQNRNMELKKIEYDENDRPSIINIYNYEIDYDSSGERFDGYNEEGEIEDPDANGKIPEWQLMGGRRIENFEFNWKDQPERSVLYDFVIRDDGTKDWETGEIVEKKYDIKGNAIRTKTLSFKLIFTTGDRANLENYERRYKKLNITENRSIDSRGNIRLSISEDWVIEDNRLFPQDLDFIPEISGNFFKVKGNETRSSQFDFRGNAKYIQKDYYVYEEGFKHYTHGQSLTNSYNLYGLLEKRTTNNYNYDLKVGIEGILKNDAFNYLKSFTSKEILTNSLWDDRDNVTYSETEEFLFDENNEFADGYLNDSDGAFILDDMGLKQLDDTEFVKTRGYYTISEEYDGQRHSLRSYIYNYTMKNGVKVFEGQNGQKIENEYDDGNLVKNKTASFTIRLVEGEPLFNEDGFLNTDAIVQEFRKLEIRENTYNDDAVDTPTDIVIETWEFIGDNETFEGLIEVQGKLMIDDTKFEKRNGREIHQENFTFEEDPQVIKTSVYYYEEDTLQKIYVEGNLTEKIYDYHRNTVMSAELKYRLDIDESISEEDLE
ncbi:hypothetical protein BVX93_01385, partial [bacterium B13(2017)]